MSEKVKIGLPYPRISVEANIVRCKHPDIKYSDFSHYKAGHIHTLGEKSWNDLYDDYDNLPVIKSGDLILNGRNDINGGPCVVRLVDIHGHWNGANTDEIYHNCHLFDRVDLIEELPSYKGVIPITVEEDIDRKYRKIM